MRLRLALLVVSLIGLSCVSGAALASSAMYTVTVETTLTPPNCRWTGVASVTLSGSNFAGTTTLPLDLTGPPGPPPGPDPFCVALLSSLSGTVQGSVTGSAINGTAMSGVFTIPFTGTTPDGGMTASGTWQFFVPPIIFPPNGLNAHGTWSAVEVATAPVLDDAGLAALVVVLLAAAAWRMRRAQHSV